MSIDTAINSPRSKHLFPLGIFLITLYFAFIVMPFPAAADTQTKSVEQQLFQLQKNLSQGKSPHLNF